MATTKKRCYYDILEVDKKATVSDVKQSYRKLALKYHPDKNTEEDTKQLFIEIQEAYQVLSDPNERTWYDNNREKILFDKDSMSKEDLEMHTFGFNIWKYFSPSCYKGYEEEGDQNFYKVYREVFESIKESERKAFEFDNEGEGQFRRFEGFGNASTGIEKVLKFYEDWDNVTTYKSFVWKEEWDTKEAPNRWVRRQMEKENKKEIQKERKFYTKTIKDLISYLKKRDPRYQSFLLDEQEKEAKKEEQKKIKIEEDKRIKQQMKHHKKQLDEERLKEVEEYYKNQEEEDQHRHHDKKQEADEDFYCDICEKGFKSQNQLSNHNNSKVHKQNLKLLMNEVVLETDKKEMIQEIVKLYEPEVKESPTKKQNKKKEVVEAKVEVPEVKKEANEGEKSSQKRKKKNRKKKDYELSSQDGQLEEPTVVLKEEKTQVNNKQIEEKEESSEDDFVASMLKNRNQKAKVSVVHKRQLSESQQQQSTKKREVKAEIKQEVKPKAKPQKEQVSDSDKQSEPEEKQLGKAKQKRLKKQEKEQEEKDKVKCLGCKEMFSSKTKLFTHIKESGHAAPKK